MDAPPVEQDVALRTAAIRSHRNPLTTILKIVGVIGILAGSWALIIGAVILAMRILT